MEKLNIEINHLTHDYGHNRGVFDVSFSVKQGEVFGFLGPNGAGKSTTIRHLMGFTKPQIGSTKLFGFETFNNGDKFLKRVGYIPGEVVLPAGLTGWEFLDMMKKLRGMKDDGRMNEFIEMFDVIPDGDTKSMSFGGKRKLAIVSAFMHDPDVLILDEPTSGLDPIMQEKFVQLIKDEKKRGKTILLSSHIFSEINDTSDTIAIIKQGRIVSNFHAESFKHSKNKTYVVNCKEIDKLKLELEKAEIKVVDENENQLVVNLDMQRTNELIEILSKFKITDFVELKETLEQYFMKYYKD